MSLSRRQKLIIVLLLMYWPGLFILAHIPIPHLVRQAGVSDKGLHFLAYLILAFLLWSAISPYNKVNWRKATVWWVILAVVGYGITDEVSQRYVAGRTCDATDFIADVAGILTSLVVVSVFDFWPASIVITGGTIFILTNFTWGKLANLLPVTTTTFHLFAYTLFALLWLRWRTLRLMPQALHKRLIVALAAPIGLLLAVELGSLIVGKGLGLWDMVLSGGGIIAVVGTSFTAGLLRRR